MVNDLAILFVKPQALKSADKANLRKAGVVVVEIDDPSAVKFVRAGAEVSSTGMLRLAMKVIAEQTDGTTCYVNRQLGMALARAVIEPDETGELRATP